MGVMKTTIFPVFAIGFLSLAGAPLLAAELPSATDPRFVRIRETLLKLEAEAEGLRGLTLRFEEPRTIPPSSHEWRVKMRSHNKLVMESWEDGGGRLDKCYLIEGKQVTVFCAEHRLPCLDGVTERVTEQWIYLAEGQPFARAVRSQRVAVGEETENPPAIPVPNAELPPGLEAWTGQIHARAFDILRGFPPARFRDIAWGWDESELAGAPPAGSSQPALRDKDWMPPEGTLALPVLRTESPEGFYGIGWGYESGPVDWGWLKADHGWEDLGEVYFSTKLASHPMPDALDKDTNFLLRMPEARAVGRTGTSHPGERQRFNHDELLVHWSPASRCAVVMEAEKWFTQTASLVWIREGKVEVANDILVPLQKAACAALRKTRHPASKEAGTEDYEFSLVKIMIGDDGSFEALVLGQARQNWQPAGSWRTRIDGRFSAAAEGQPAGLVIKKIKVLPPVREEP